MAVKRQAMTSESVPKDHAEVLAELCTDFFVLGLQISGGHVELPDIEAFRRRLLLLLDTFGKKATQRSVAPTEQEDVRYALAAFIDEAIQYSRWSERERWSQQPLQAVLFGESRAGRNFFERLKRLREQQSPALYVYYQCLALGFLGEYRLGHQAEHERLVEDLARELVPQDVKRLSPHGGREAGAAGQRARELTLPAVVLTLSVTLLVALGLYLWLNGSGAAAVELLENMSRSHSA